MHRYDERRLVGVNQRLVSLVRSLKLLSPVDFMVAWQGGLRTLEDQAKHIKSGASATMNSRHLTGHAVDLVAMVDGKPDWTTQAYRDIWAIFRDIARADGVVLRWGGHWTFPKDLGHFEMDRVAHPALPRMDPKPRPIRGLGV